MGRQGEIRLSAWIKCLMLSGVAGAAIAIPAVAETAPQAPDCGTNCASLDEILVTATRREAFSTQVPLSLVAKDRDNLDRERIANIADVSRSTPGLSLRNGWGNSTKISIRGIASGVGAPTTGIYIDDTPIQVRSLGAADIFSNAYPEVFDLERIEVLRGPQGTLFGAGSEGGTVRFITSAPSLETTNLYGKASIATTKGGEESWSAGASVSSPIVPDKLGFSLTAFGKRDGGWIDRAPFGSGTTVDKNINRNTATSLRGALTFKPTENLTFTPSLFYQKTHLHDTNQYWELLSNGNDGPYVSGSLVKQPTRDRFYLPALKGELDLGSVQLITNTAWFDRLNTMTVDYSFHIIEGLTGRATGGLGTLHFNPIPGFVSPSNFISRQRSFTQEARLQSADADSPINWTIGAFYQISRQRTQQRIESPLFPVFIQAVTGFTVPQVFGADMLEGGAAYASADGANDRQIAGFGQVDWKATDKLTLTLGARVARIKSTFANMQAGPLNSGATTSSGGAKETPFTPKFGVSYAPDSGSLVYGTVSKGFRQGGGNTLVPAQFCAGDLATLGISQVPSTYKSDSVWNYEVGAKKASRDGRFSLQGSAFVIEWKDIQQNVPLQNCGFAYTANLGKALSKGFDAQVSVRPFDPLTLRASVAYTNAKYTQTATAASGAVLLVSDGDKLPGPPWQVHLSGVYDFALGENAGYVQVNYDYASSYQRVPGFPAFSGDPLNERAEATNFVGARGGLTFGPVQASVFVDNLLNSKDTFFRTRDNLFSSYFRRIGMRPRTVGLELIFRN